MEIKVKGLTHIYQANSPFEQKALENINLTIPSGSFTSIIGHTGSGKSTFIQHLNGLLKPTEGSIKIGDFTLSAGAKKQNLKPLRQKVGMVFQYPEHQLFEETIEKDICFAPLNFGVSLEEAKRRTREAIELVHLPESILEKSPFDLSGGQMRRVAIAGVLASEPEVIILDEPTAGLDPKGRRDILSLFSKLHKEKGYTTIMVTHSMDDAAFYSDEVVVMDKGKVVMKAPPVDVFSHTERLKSLGLDIPVTMQFLEKLEKQFGEKITTPLFSLDETAEHIIRFLKKEANSI